MTCSPLDAMSLQGNAGDDRQPCAVVDRDGPTKSPTPRPLCIDLFCGLGGWTEGFLAEGWDVIGFDIEQHVYGEHRYPAQLVLQDVLTLHGSQFKDADCIVASPPCQFFSYTFLPFSKGKALASDVRADPNRLTAATALFDACFRIQDEAMAVAGWPIPLVIENVVGAQAWVGPAAWHYGSYYLWGDVPALMPPVARGRMKSQIPATGKRFDERIATTPEQAHALHYWLPAQDGVKMGKNGLKGTAAERRACGSPGGYFQAEKCGGIKNGKDWFGSGENCSAQRRQSSKSTARKAASAAIAKIPFALARHIAQVYKPRQTGAA